MGLDSSAISDLITKNANGLMTQQDFFRVFLMSVQNGISTNQRLEQIEKRLTEAEEKIKSTEEAPAVEAVEAVEVETPVSEAVEEPMEVEAADEEPAAETVVPETDKTVDESMDISSMVEIAEKTRTSRKRGKVSQAGRASQSPIPSRAKNKSQVHWRRLTLNASFLIQTINPMDLLKASFLSPPYYLSKDIVCRVL